MQVGAQNRSIALRDVDEIAAGPSQHVTACQLLDFRGFGAGAAGADVEGRSNGMHNVTAIDRLSRLVHGCLCKVYRLRSMTYALRWCSPMTVG